MAGRPWSQETGSDLEVGCQDGLPVEKDQPVEEGGSGGACVDQECFQCQGGGIVGGRVQAGLRGPWRGLQPCRGSSRWPASLTKPREVLVASYKMITNLTSLTML